MLINTSNTLNGKYFCKIPIASCCWRTFIMHLIITRTSEFFHGQGFVKLSCVLNMLVDIINSFFFGRAISLVYLFCVKPTPIFNPQMNCNIIDVFALMGFQINFFIPNAALPLVRLKTGSICAQLRMLKRAPLRKLLAPEWVACTMSCFLPADR